MATGHLNTAAQSIEYYDNPELKNLPIVGPAGERLGNATGRLMVDRDGLALVEFIGASGEAFMIVVGGASVGKNIGADLPGSELVNRINNLPDTAFNAMKKVMTGEGGAVSLVDVDIDAVQNGFCFVAGTLVLTYDGVLVAIEDIETGDLVLSRDQDTGEMAWRKVTKTFITPEQQVLELRLENGNKESETLGVTPTHPFWVKERGWTLAGSLLPGDEIYTSSGGWVRVSGSTWLSQTQTVYNLEVEEFHTYFVGEFGAWVHNYPCSDNSSSNGYTISDARRQHILEGDPGVPGSGHGPNRGNTRGAFPDSWTDDQATNAIERVANSSESTWKQSTGSGYDSAPITKGGPASGGPTHTSTGRPVRYTVRGYDHGKTIEVVVEPGGEGIVTGYVKE